MSGDTVIWFWIGSHDEYERIDQIVSEKFPGG